MAFISLFLILPMLGIVFTLEVLKLLVPIYIGWAVFMIIVAIVAYILLKRKHMFDRYHEGWKKTAMTILKYFIILDGLFYLFTIFAAIYFLCVFP